MVSIVGVEKTKSEWKKTRSGGCHGGRGPSKQACMTNGHGEGNGLRAPIWKDKGTQQVDDSIGATGSRANGGLGRGLAAQGDACNRSGERFADRIGFGSVNC